MLNRYTLFVVNMVLSNEDTGLDKGLKYCGRWRAFLGGVKLVGIQPQLDYRIINYKARLIRTIEVKSPKVNEQQPQGQPDYSL